MASKDWESMIPFGELRREVDKLFDSFGVGRGFPFRIHNHPICNVWEDEEYFHIEAEVPNLTMSEVEVQVLGGELTIKGRWHKPAKENVTYHRQERPSGEFSRVLPLPQDVNSENIEAVLKNGLLLITLPKTARAKVHKVAIRSD